MSLSLKDWIASCRPSLASGKAHHQTEWSDSQQNIAYINPINRLSAVHDNRAQMQQILNSPSMVRFDASWDTDDLTESEYDSWDDTDSDDSSSDDGLQVYHPEQKTQHTLHSGEDIRTKHTSHTYWNIAQHEAYKYPFCLYAEKHFNKMGQSAAHLFKHQPYTVLKHALIKVNLHLDKEAQQIWKSIHSFMGTRVSAKHDPYAHVHKLLSFALNGCQDLKDEIYCQILKQITGCLSTNALVHGWTLISICCSIFPPSHELAHYVSSFLFAHTKKSGVIGLCAVFALKALDQTMICGSRHILPTPLEIQRIQQRQPMQITLYFCNDDMFRNVLLYSQTTAQQMISAVVHALGITHHQSCGIFEVNRDDTRWPYTRELDMDERVLDVCRQKKMCLQLQWKAWNTEEEETYSCNEWTLCYLTSVWNVKNDMFRLTEREVCDLAAMQLQYEYGTKEESFYTSNVLQDMIDRFIPNDWLDKYTSKQWLHKIMNQHSSYNELNPSDIASLCIEYLRTSSAADYFGAQWFVCRKGRLGISEQCIVCMDCDTCVITDRFSMDEIVGYTYTEHLFTLVIQTAGTAQKHEFETIFGKQMVHLLSNTTRVTTSKETMTQLTLEEEDDADHVLREQEDHVMHSYPTPSIQSIAIKRHPTDSSEGQPRNIVQNIKIDDTLKDIPHDFVDLLTHTDEQQQQFRLVNSALYESSDEEEEAEDAVDDEGWINPKLDEQIFAEIAALIDDEHECDTNGISNAIMQYTTNDNNEGNHHSYRDNNGNKGSGSYGDSYDDNSDNNEYNYNGNGDGNGRDRRDQNRDNGDKQTKDLNEEEEEEEDQKEEEKEDDEHGLNRNAKEFVPQHSQKAFNKSTLTTIDETHAFPGRSSHHYKKYKRHYVAQSSYDPMHQYRAKGQIYIARECSSKIADQIGEMLNNVYVFIDKSLSLQTGQSLFHNDTLWVIHYGFHHKQSNELLYCVAVRSSDGSRKWNMMHKLYTAQEMQNLYHIEHTSLPKSIRSLQFNTEIVNKTHIIQQKLSEPKEIQTIIRCTPWHKIAIFNRNDNKKRMILKLNKPEFMKHARRFVNVNKNQRINVIPILMFDTQMNVNYCAYHVEYVWITRIEKDIDIGISFILNPDDDVLMVSGIHLDKTFILNQHQLAMPQCHSCDCLHSFVSNITHLKIGNPDDDLNRIKDLTKKFKTVTQELMVKQKELSQRNQELKQMQMEIERLKQMVEMYHNNQSIASSSVPLSQSQAMQSPCYSSSMMPSSSAAVVPNIPNLAAINSAPMSIVPPIPQPLLYPYANSNVMWIPNQPF